jgi:5-(carboxyamino)imidazole ribonucleotide synthase
VELWPPPAALEAAQDRVTEKRLFEKVGLPVARYVPVAGVAEVAAAVAAIGTPCLIKTRREGYDGKGQVRIDEPGRAEEAWVRLGSVPAVVEEVVDFDRELSALGVRARDGSSAFYPPVENHHAGGILRVSLAPAPGVPEAMRVRAEGYTRALMEELGYVGVLAVELFVVGGELYGNEMAPRVHNSGHYSIEGAVTSQFANHVRAVTGGPLGPTDPTGDTIMVNLIGDVPDESSLLGIPGAHLHLYGKRPRPGRKVGHVTLRLDDPERLREAFGRVRTLVPGTPDVLSRRPAPERLSGSRRSPI